MRTIGFCSEMDSEAAGLGGEGRDCACPPPALDSSTTKTSPRRTSKTMVESYREAERLARRHRFREVEAEPAPINAQPEIADPAPDGRELIARHSSRSIAHEPALPGVAEHDEVRPLK